MNWTAFEKISKDIAGFELLDVGKQPITLSTLISFCVIVLVTFYISRLTQRLIERVLKRRQVNDHGAISLVSRLGYYFILFGGLAVALEIIGIHISTLFTAGAVLAVGIGFAMQNITQNFVSGIILLFERTIVPGDVLEIDGQVVRVEQMQIRSTVARARDGEDLIIPNSLLVQSSVKNYTLQDSSYRIVTRVGVSYSSDMDRVKQVLEEAAAGMRWQKEGIESAVFLFGFGTSSVDFDVCVWTENPWQLRRQISELNFAIWNALKKAEIEIAFPQLDVHFDKTAPLAE